MALTTGAWRPGIEWDGPGNCGRGSDRLGALALPARQTYDILVLPALLIGTCTMTLGYDSTLRAGRPRGMPTGGPHMSPDRGSPGQDAAAGPAADKPLPFSPQEMHSRTMEMPAPAARPFQRPSIPHASLSRLLRSLPRTTAAELAVIPTSKTRTAGARNNAGRVDPVS